VISLDEALERLLAALEPIGSRLCPLEEAHGRVLAEPVIALRTQPPTATSAMDGYAVHTEDLGSGPVRLTLAGESAAGRPLAGKLARGTAAAISTGAAIPLGATQVVVREESSRDGGVVTLDARPQRGNHIRPAGVDFSKGDEVIPAGRRLDAASCGLAAAALALEVEVRRKPRVAILSTGDELVEPGQPAGDHQIVNSNAVALGELIAERGGKPRYLGIARDTPASVRTGFERAQGADLLVTIGGASIGEHDPLKAVFADLGGVLIFDKIALKPGKPAWFGRLLDGPAVLGLPGNPVSAMVVARLLLVPAIGKLMGETDAGAWRWRAATLAVPLPPTGPRETLLRGMLEPGDRVRPLANQDSAALSVLVAADVLVRRRAGDGNAKEGDRVEVLPLR
jgi:molybdopterin molybdotransferase